MKTIYNFFLGSTLRALMTLILLNSIWGIYLSVNKNIEIAELKRGVAKEKLQSYKYYLKLKKCEQIKSIPHCSEREIILFKDVIDKCFIERD